MTNDVGWGATGMSEVGGGTFTLPVGTVAFLLTDVEGSTRAWESEPDAMVAAMERHNAILDAAVSSHGGVSPPAQGEGDSIVAAFSRPSDAVLAALDAQQALATEDWPTLKPLLVRMAVHTGEARFLTDGNYAGQAIIRTARLRAIAHGGQVLVSQPARDLTVDHLGDQIAFVDLGEHRLRDLARPERVFQLAGEGLASTFEPLRSLDAHPHNLAVQLSSFVGREAEVAEVTDLVGLHRLVTVAGAGGAGKTRLAQQVAGARVGHAADGVWWVELSDVTDPGALPALLATTIGVRDDFAPAGDAQVQLAERLADHDVLLVLDNCEHLVDDVAGLVDRLLRRCADVRILATSREPLGVSGEQVWQVPPLRVPSEPERVPVASLGQYDGVRLFVERAQSVRPNFQLDETCGPLVASICARVDGIPLAIELAASRCRSLAPERILRGLDDALGLLTAGGRAVQPRQQTLEASIAWSHDLLDEAEQIALRRLSVFTGGCTLDDAEVVLDDAPLERSEVLDLLDRLVAQSLLYVDDSRGEPRYRVLETIRQFAARRLVDADEAEQLRRRHAERYRSVAADIGVEVEGADDLVALARATAESANLGSAMSAFADDGDWDAFARIAIDLGLARVITEPERNVRDLTAAMEQVSKGSDLAPALLATRALARGLGFDFLGSYADAARCVELTEADGRSQRLATCMLGRSTCWVDAEAGVKVLTSCIDESRAAGDHIVEVLAAMFLGFHAVLHGDVPTGRIVFDDTAALDRSSCPTLLRATHASLAGCMLAILGHIDEAALRVGDADEWVASLSVATGLTHEHLIMGTYVGRYVRFTRMWVAMAGGDPIDLAEVAESVTHGRATGIRQMLILAWCVGHMRYFEGDVDGATDELEELIRYAKTLGTQGYVVAGTVLLAGIHQDRGDFAGAEQMLVEIEELAAGSGWSYDRARRDHRLGALALVRGAVSEAERLAHLALDRAVAGDFWWELSIALDLLAEVAAATDSPAEAVRVAGFVAAFRDAHPLPPRFACDSARLEAAVAFCRDDLGPDAFEAAWADGTAMPLERALEYVRRARGERKRPTTGWESLTPTEWQVVRLVQAGRTNPEIASELYMSRDTVKAHLKHVFTKLDIRTRAELAAEATARS